MEPLLYPPSLSLSWVDCAYRFELSSSIHQIPNLSIQCLTAKTHENGSHICFPGPRNPTHEDQLCEIFPENSITRTVAIKGELVEGIIDFKPMGSSETGTIKHLVFSCASTFLLNGLASGAKGMLGLGRTRISLPSQISNTFNTQRKFNLCLSSSNGVIIFDAKPHDSYFGADILRSLTYTPLITYHGHKSSQAYFINVKFIKISGKKLALNTSLLANDQVGFGGTKLSSIVPYTTTESSIFSLFTKAFVKAATHMNMTMVDPVAPFAHCINSRGIDSTQIGPNVPIIDLVLQSEMVKWRICGRNSMVQLGKEVMCLGFLDGGLKPNNRIVIGGYQLEDTLVQFDLGNSMLGLSPSLLKRQITCSDFKIFGMPKASF